MAQDKQDPGTTGWTYRRAAAGPPIEIGLWQGDMRPRIGRHFHDEGQISLVIAGRHGFVVGNRTIEATAGECILIPPGHPHAPLARADAPAVVVNLYLPRSLWPAATSAGISRRMQDLLLSGTDIATLADEAGLSREQFTRNFRRRTGMPPHAYRLMRRLNRARALLREGEAVALVAAEVGFADQSHFGRHFRHAFGISPAAYRRAFARQIPSHSFQTEVGPSS
jgi:AraC-like DNA-binding protein